MHRDVLGCTDVGACGVWARLLLIAGMILPGLAMGARAGEPDIGCGPIETPSGQPEWSGRQIIVKFTEDVTEDAVAFAHSRGVTVVCAAGNEFRAGNPTSYPAAYDKYCIAVGATRYDETRAFYSNTGSYTDVAAPGGDMSVDQDGDGYGDGVLQQTFGVDPNVFAYWFYQGTSMAAPHVSGAVALLISNGVTHPDTVRKILETTPEISGPSAGTKSTDGD